VTTVEPANSRSDARSRAKPSTPGATIEVRHVDAGRGVTITTVGMIGRNDAAVLSRQLHTELDATETPEASRSAGHPAVRPREERDEDGCCGNS
jgi:hypothetical protein